MAIIPDTSGKGSRPVEKLAMTAFLFPPRATTYVGALLIFVAAIAFRVGLIHAPGEFDEFYHLLAARGWIETGSPRILDGEYWRGALFTRMIAGLFRVTRAEDMPTARLVSIVAGSLVPMLLFLWIKRVVGPGVAALAAAFAILWPQGILESQFARFYALHVLTFCTGAVASHLLIIGRSSSRLFYGLAAAICWSLAAHLQVSSVIGISGAFLGGLLIVATRQKYSLRCWLIIGTLLLILFLISTAVLTGSRDTLERAWAFYRWTPGHAAALRDYYGFYFNQLKTAYGLLWLASFLLVPLGLWTNAALTLYCGAIFATCFLAHSFGGMKSLRYLSYAMPFLFVMWALGLRSAFGLITRRFTSRTHLGLAVMVGIAVAASTNFIPRSLELACGEGLPPRGDWRDGRAVIGDWIDAPFIATTRELHQIAYIGPYDVLFSQSRVSELNPPRDFVVDTRTGRPVVGSVENIARIFRCVPEGLLVTYPDWWHTEGWEGWLGPQLIESKAIITMREAGAVLAIRWKNERPPPDACRTLWPASADP